MMVRDRLVLSKLGRVAPPYVMLCILGDPRFKSATTMNGWSTNSNVDPFKQKGIHRASHSFEAKRPLYHSVMIIKRMRW